MVASLAAQILDVLPQTQCTRCGYPDCEAYATAIASVDAAINQCPPGGAQGVLRLAAITGLAVQALNPDNGIEAPRSLAVIDEAWCIGCTLCIKACPTDAILGSNKRMHTVIEPYCTGCELCLPVCPVDCIVLENVSNDATGWDAWSAPQATLARARYAESRARRQRDSTGLLDQEPSDALPAAPASEATAQLATSPTVPPKPSKQDVIAAAQARARALRQTR